jgi:hypothetical protein
MVSRCTYAEQYQQIIHETIQITDQLTVSQYKAAQQCLDLLYQQLAAKMSPFHYGAIGTAAPHYCLKDAWEESHIRLRLLAMLSPAPPPEPPPAPRPKRRSLADVLKGYEAVKETYYGDRENGTDTRHR